jgi:hypothetical protein
VITYRVAAACGYGPQASTDVSVAFHLLGYATVSSSELKLTTGSGMNHVFIPYVPARDDNAQPREWQRNVVSCYAAMRSILLALALVCTAPLSIYHVRIADALVSSLHCPLRWLVIRKSRVCV